MLNKASVYDPATQVIVIWSIADVLAVRDDLTDEQAMAVLQESVRTHNSEAGINWDSFKCVADIMFPKDDGCEAEGEETRDVYGRTADEFLRELFAAEYCDEYGGDPIQ